MPRRFKQRLAQPCLTALLATLVRRTLRVYDARTEEKWDRLREAPVLCCLSHAHPDRDVGCFGEQSILECSIDTWMITGGKQESPIE